MPDPLDRRTFATAFAASVVLGNESLAAGTPEVAPMPHGLPTEAPFARDYPKPGFKVFDPQLKDYLPAEGRTVPPTPFWHRRLQDGDVRFDAERGRFGCGGAGLAPQSPDLQIGEDHLQQGRSGSAGPKQRARAGTVVRSS